MAFKPYSDANPDHPRVKQAQTNALTLGTDTAILGDVTLEKTSETAQSFFISETDNNGNTTYRDNSFFISEKVLSKKEAAKHNKIVRKHEQRCR